MEITLAVPDEIAAEARARGVSIEAYVLSLIEQSRPPVGFPHTRTPQQIENFFDALAEGSENLPALPTEGFSRESFYSDPRIDGLSGRYKRSPAERNGYGLSVPETDQRARVVEALCTLLEDSKAVHQEWRNLLVAYAACGVQVHDARLAAAMRVHHVERVLTFNGKDFDRLPGIEAIHPRDVLRTLA